MKKNMADYMKMSRKDLAGSLKEETASLGKLLVSISLGREKKTHLVKSSRRRLAVINTVMAQKEFSHEE